MLLPSILCLLVASMQNGDFWPQRLIRFRRSMLDAISLGMVSRTESNWPRWKGTDLYSPKR